MKNLITLLLSFLALALPCKADSAKTYTWRETLDAIRVVETGGSPNEGVGVLGDGGAAAGPYQIHRIYHTDAAERDTTLTAYSKCLSSKAYSERVIDAYMGRYARAERDRLKRGVGTLADVEKIARIHNGGPRGHRKVTTLHYWRKVSAQL